MNGNYSKRVRLSLEALEVREVPAVLGAADAFNVFGVDHTAITVSGLAADNGNLAVGAAGSASLVGKAVVTGSLSLGSTATYSHSKQAGAASVVSADLSQASSDAIAASQNIAMMAPTQTFGVIASSTAINSIGVQNVINVAGITLSGSSSLILTGGANDYFYINVTGPLTLGNSSSIQLVGGVKASHVIFNVLGSGPAVQVTGTSVMNGAILALNRDITLGAQLNGSLIGGESHLISIYGSAKLNGIAFEEPPVVAAPTTLSGFVFDISGSALNGIEVDLFDSTGAMVGSTLTNPDGSYSFTNLADGVYSLAVVLPPRYVSISETVGTVNGNPDGTDNVSSHQIMAINLAAGQTGSGYNFVIGIPG